MKDLLSEATDLAIKVLDGCDGNHDEACLNLAIEAVRWRRASSGAFLRLGPQKQLRPLKPPPVTPITDDWIETGADHSDRA